jgi:hypothetical protein
MADLPPNFLTEQQSILREIRDELRASRGAAGGSAMSAAAVSAPPRPAAAVKAQLAADWVASSEFRGFGWSNAYTNQVRSSLFGDFAALSGVVAGPNSMTSDEYQAYASESFALRGQSMAAFMLPGAMSRLRGMAGDIHANSPRMFRAGSMYAGIMGSGVDRLTAREMAHSVQRMASTDLRLSEADYSTVLRGGMQSGQFDLVDTPRELMSNLRELSQTVADLTRTTRLSVSEISGSLGQLRQAGVADPGAQAAIIRTLDSAGRVAGVSPAMMSQLATQSIGTGLSMGLGAQTSAGIISDRMLVGRTLSQAGIISPHVIAAGGGLPAIAQAQAQAVQQFMSSDMGYAAMIGAAGSGSSDFLGSLNAGIGMAGGSLQQALRFRAGRMEALGGDSAMEGQRMFVQSIQARMSMLGISDFTGQEAQDAAFEFARGDMGDAAAIAFARENFSVAGRSAAFRGRVAATGYERARSAGLEVDTYTLNAGFPGALRRARGGVRRFMSDVQGGLMGFGENVSERITSGLLGMPTTRDLMERRIRSGATLDSVRPEDLVSAIQNPAGVPESSLDLYNQDSGFWTSAGGISGGLAGFGLTVAKFGLAAATVSNPIGIAVGATLATAGFFGGSALGSYLSGEQGNAPVTTLRGQSVIAFQEHRAAMKSDPEYARMAILGGNPTVASNTRFQALMRKGTLGADSVQGELAMQQEVSRIAAETGSSIDEVYAALSAVGHNPSLEVANNIALTGGLKPGEFDKKYQELTRDIGSGFNFATTTAKGLVRDLITKDDATTRAQLSQLGLSASDITTIRRRAGTMQEGDRNALLSGLNIDVRRGGSAAWNRMNADVRSTLLGSSSLVGADRESLDKLLGSDSLGAILSGGGVRDLLVRGGHDDVLQMADLARTISTDDTKELADQIGEDNVNKIRRLSGGDTSVQQKLALKAMMESSGGMQAMKETREANLLLQAAETLDRINTELSSQ